MPVCNGVCSFRHHMIVTLDPASHTYRDDAGRQYVSVTTLLGVDNEFDGPSVAARCVTNQNSKYYGWSVEECLVFWQASADLGTRFHGQIENWIKTRELPSKNDPNYDSLVHFTRGRWKGKLLSETVVYDSELLLAGTADIIEERHDRDFVHDVKTSRTISDEKLRKYSMQLDIYRRLRQGMTGKPTYVGVIIWFEDFVEDPKAAPRSLKPIAVGPEVDAFLERWRKSLTLAKAA